VSTPVTLGRGLGRAFALATIFGMAIFGIAMGLMIYFTEVGETCSAAGQIEDPPLEIVEQTSLAFAFALPFGIAISLRINRSLTHETTDRLDEMIASASAMTGEKLAERLPVSNTSDPLDTLAVALNGMLQRIETGVRAQAQFAADASHELRTPLAVISTNLEVARRKERAPSHWEHVADDTLGEVRRMNVLVDKLLELARAGNAGLKHEHAELRQLAAAAIARADALTEKLGVGLELAPGSDVDAEIDVEAVAIVLDNLIRNALDHTPRGTAVTVRIGPGKRIIVDDRGPGVPPEARERIFEPFARGVQRMDRSTGPGLGLGLAICKRIVDGHHGKIHVEDRDGGGARFVVALPA
jgi:signal transduction histidine kinase